MALDRLTQAGKNISKTYKNTDFVTRRYSENFPQIEKMRDVFGFVGSFIFEFKTQRPGNHVLLNLFFEPIFDENSVVRYDKLPLAITQTGLSVGLEGEVGAQNIFYPVSYLGDLNFAGGDNYSVVFQIETFGNIGIVDHKVVFEEGGVFVTDVTTITATTITIPLNYSKLLDPPRTIAHNAYIYGSATGMSAGAWLYYKSVQMFKNGFPYEPRVIGI